MDRHQALVFAPLQGTTAHELLQTVPINGDAIVYWQAGQLELDASDAIGAILGDLAWPWKLGKLILWIPRGLREWMYRWVAEHRYRIFKRYRRCPVPEVSIRQRFLP